MAAIEWFLSSRGGTRICHKGRGGERYLDVAVKAVVGNVGSAALEPAGEDLALADIKVVVQVLLVPLRQPYNISGAVQQL